MHVKKSIEAFTEKHLENDLKEACIGYVVTNPVRFPANHQTRFSVSHLGFPIGISSASTGTGCGTWQAMNGDIVG